MNLAIRHATAKDAKAITNLSFQLGYSLSEAATVLNLELLENSERDIVYVAVQNERVIGWMQVSYCVKLESRPFCEIMGLVTDEHVRGKGVGRMLVMHAAEWGRQRNCATLVVRTNVVRTEAHRFYEVCGFTLKKEQKVYGMSL